MHNDYTVFLVQVNNLANINQLILFLTVDLILLPSFFLSWMDSLFFLYYQVNFSVFISFHPQWRCVSFLEGKSPPTLSFFLGMCNVQNSVQSWIGNKHRCLVMLLVSQSSKLGWPSSNYEFGVIQYPHTATVFWPLKPATPCYVRPSENESCALRLASETQTTLKTATPSLHSQCSLGKKI